MKLGGAISTVAVAGTAWNVAQGEPRDALRLLALLGICWAAYGADRVLGPPRGAGRPRRRPASVAPVDSDGSGWNAGTSTERDRDGFLAVTGRTAPGGEGGARDSG